MFTLEQLRAFVAVAEEGGFGRAAERLHVTQPPLSRAIQKLEHGLGFDLFVRTPHGADLTAAGEVFLAEARRIVTLAREAPLKARRVSAGSAGTVRAGFTAMSASSVLGPWLRACSTALPDVTFQLAEGVTSDLTAQLVAGDLDVALTRPFPDDDTLDSRIVRSETLILAMPRHHPLSAFQGRPSLHDIAEYPIVTYSPTGARYFNELVASAFNLASIVPTYVQQVTQVANLLALVASGVGLALVPAAAAAFRLSNVEYREVLGLGPIAVETIASWRRDNLNPAARATIDLLPQA